MTTQIIQEKIDLVLASVYEIMRLVAFVCYFVCYAPTPVG